jgi:hypothetical protein
LLERETTSSARALVAFAVLLASYACGGSRFQSDEGAGGSSGVMGGAGKGSGGKSSGDGGASSAGAIGQGGTLGVSGGSSTGGSGGEPSAGGVPPGGGPSGGVGNEGGSMSGMGGFNVAGVGGLGGGMSVSCATDPNCLNCCRETIGNAAFVVLAYECACSDCYPVCQNLCDGNTPSQSCEFCIVSELQNAAASVLCYEDRQMCDGDLDCTKYVNCLATCEP